MKEAVKQVAKLLAFLVFLTIFLVGYPFGEAFTIELFVPVLVKAIVGATLFGIGGIIIGDIIIKGVVEDIDSENLEPLEGGFEQQIHTAKQQQRVGIVEREIEIKKQTKKKTK